MTLTAPQTTAIPGNPAKGLVCRNCGATFGLIAEHACAECFGPLEVDYDAEAMRAVTREQIEAGPQNIWRYVALLPVGHDPASRVSLDPGMTPLIRADRLAEELRLTRGLSGKEHSPNPTHSFKDRVVSMAATAAKGLGYTKIAAASTGNLANSVAAHAARAGVQSFVFIPSDLEPGKVEDPVFVTQNGRPYSAEGSKPMGYEIAEQLGWRIPAQVVIPMASGSLLTKVDKAFRELTAAGIVEATEWAIFGAQSAGCDPIAPAFAHGWGGREAAQP